MCRHILLLTDGLALSREAVVASIADEYLAFVAACAAAQEVRRACMKAFGHESAREIVAMASHGWRGEAGQWPGSVTLDVLRHSRVPVLAHKAAAQESAGTRRQEERR